MAKQLRLPIGSGSARFAKPVPELVHSARQWSKDRGQYYSPVGFGDLQVNHQIGFAAGREYQKSMATGQDSERMKPAYEAMRKETVDQFAHLTGPPEKGGLGVKVEVTPHDPYSSPQEMRDDFVNNKRLKVMSTETTGGHQFFTNQENDQFRAVHDAYGHLATGRGFSRHGEEAAFQHHSMMYSEAARPALASETRGQNSVLNYGTGEFPDQSKGTPLVGLPENLAKRKPSLALQDKQFKPQGVQESLF